MSTVVFNGDILSERLIHKIDSMNFGRVLSDVKPFLIHADEQRFLEKGTIINVIKKSF
ncbi:MAG: hypothetical protein AABZ14_01285 [Candidatus Margulisiibacteriota bacterium]